MSRCASVSPSVSNSIVSSMSCCEYREAFFTGYKVHGVEGYQIQGMTAIYEVCVAYFVLHDENFSVTMNSQHPQDVYSETAAGQCTEIEPLVCTIEQRPGSVQRLSL